MSLREMIAITHQRGNLRKRLSQLIEAQGDLDLLGADLHFRCAERIKVIPIGDIEEGILAGIREHCFVLIAETKRPAVAIDCFLAGRFRGFGCLFFCGNRLSPYEFGQWNDGLNLLI